MGYNFTDILTALVFTSFSLNNISAALCVVRKSVGYILYSSEAIRINFESHIKKCHRNIKFGYQEFVVQLDKVFVAQHY